MITDLQVTRGAALETLVSIDQDVEMIVNTPAEVTGGD